VSQSLLKPPVLLTIEMSLGITVARRSLTPSISSTIVSTTTRIVAS